MNSLAVPETVLPVNALDGPPAGAGTPARAGRGIPAKAPEALRRGSDELLDLAIAVWRQRGLALIDPLLIDADDARQAVLSEANRLYGRRGVLSMDLR